MVYRVCAAVLYLLVAILAVYHIPFFLSAAYAPVHGGAGKVVLFYFGQNLFKREVKMDAQLLLQKRQEVCKDKINHI